MNDIPDPPPPPDPMLAPWLLTGAGGGRRLSSSELFGQAREVEIDHQGVIYRLKITSLGRLLLTK